MTSGIFKVHGVLIVNGERQMAKIGVTFLGTSGSLPTKKRSQPAIHLSYKDKSILWDCGEGTQQQITKTSISPFKIDEIYISHLHPDHYIGLWGLIRTLDFMGRKNELMVQGPRNLDRYLDVFKGGTKRLNYPINFKKIQKGTIRKEKSYEVKAFPVEHGVNSYGFKFLEKPGINLDKDKISQYGLLNHPKCRELKEKGEITYKGEKIKLEDVMKPKKKGKKIVYSGDTPACKSLEEAAEGADLLIVDSSFGEDKKNKAKEYKHGEAKEMAKLAKRAEVGKLILTHFSNRYDDESILEEEAREVFEESYAAKDLMEVTV